MLGLASAPLEEHEAPIVLHRLDDAVVEAVVVVDTLVDPEVAAPAVASRAVAHPALRQLGLRATPYVRTRRRKRRLNVSRQVAGAILTFGVLVAIPTLAFAEQQGAIANGTALVASANADTDVIATRLAPSRLLPPTFGPPTTHIRATPLRVATFAGAFAIHRGRPVWVAFPADAGDPFLSCTRRIESDRAGGYAAVSSSGIYRGAYQFLRSTWNTVAQRVGRGDLVGVDPATAKPRDQDFLALYLYRWLGAAPWNGRCGGL